MGMRDQLFGGVGPAPHLPNLSPETQAVGFDETTIATLGQPVPLGGLGVYAPELVYTVPAVVDRAELRGLAVHGRPEGLFQTTLWWQLYIQTAATQEILFQSRIHTTFPTNVSPPRTSGFQFGRYGCLAEPAEVFAQLRQSQQLLVAVFDNGGHPYAGTLPNAVTLYVRVRGLLYSGKQ